MTQSYAIIVPNTRTVRASVLTDIYKIFNEFWIVFGYTLYPTHYSPNFVLYLLNTVPSLISFSLHNLYPRSYNHCVLSGYSGDYILVKSLFATGQQIARSEVTKVGIPRTQESTLAVEL